MMHCNKTISGTNILPKSKTDEPNKNIDDAPILIKKYPNRRLYNTSTSSYIVLDDLVELVKSDKPFEIRDTKTDKDITREILNQIIFERETGKGGFHFPLEVQKQLIGMYDDTYAKLMPGYLKESLDVFAAERERMKSTMENVVEQNTKAMMQFGQDMVRQNMEIFQKSWELFGNPASSRGSSPTSSDDVKNETSDPMASETKESELDSLQEQINALQERLKDLSK